MTKKRFKSKIIFKRKKRYTILKDKALKSFLLQHLTPIKINFEKVKKSILNGEYEDEKIFKKIFAKDEITKKEHIPFPFFSLNNFYDEKILENKNGSNFEEGH